MFPKSKAWLPISPPPQEWHICGKGLFLLWQRAGGQLPLERQSSSQKPNPGNQRDVKVVLTFSPQEERDSTQSNVGTRSCLCQRGEGQGSETLSSGSPIPPTDGENLLRGPPYKKHCSLLHSEDLGMVAAAAANLISNGQSKNLVGQRSYLAMPASKNTLGGQPKGVGRPHGAHGHNTEEPSFRQSSKVRSEQSLGHTSVERPQVVLQRKLASFRWSAKPLNLWLNLSCWINEQQLRCVCTEGGGEGVSRVLEEEEGIVTKHS